MNATDITKALDGVWRGSSGMAKCPAHDDRNPSLSITEKEGRVLVKCFAGCEQDAVIAALKACGAWDGTRSTARVVEQFTRDQVMLESITAAREIWASCSASDQTETYLRSRGITLPAPPTLRFISALPHTPTGLHLPAMVAAIQNPSRSITAVQRTYLTADCSRKAGVHLPKLSRGPFEGGAIRLAHAGEALGLSEGIETALSAMQLHDVPVWAACGSRMHNVALPDCVREVHLFGDNGEPGHAAAEKAADRFTREGRRVLIRYPVEQHGDWNDALCARRAA